MGDKNAAAGASLNALRAHQVQAKKETSSAYRVPNVREQALAGLAGCSRPVVPLINACMQLQCRRQHLPSDRGARFRPLYTRRVFAHVRPALHA